MMAALSVHFNTRFLRIRTGLFLGQEGQSFRWLKISCLGWFLKISLLFWQCSWFPGSVIKLTIFFFSACTLECLCLHRKWPVSLVLFTRRFILSIWKAEWQSERKRSSIHQFTSHVATVVLAGLNLIQHPGTPFWFSMWVEGPKSLQPFPLHSLAHSLEA